MLHKICLSHVAQPSPPSGRYPAVLSLGSIGKHHNYFSCYLNGSNRERDAIYTCASLATYLRTPFTISSSDPKNSTLAYFIFYSGEHSQIAAVLGVDRLKVLPLYCDNSSDPS
jgi:hypothetical protein